MGCVGLSRRLQSRRQSQPAYCRANGRRHVRQGERYSGLEGEGLGPSALRKAHTATRPSGWRCGCSSRRLLAPDPLPLPSRHHSTAPPSLKRYEVETPWTREARRSSLLSSTVVCSHLTLQPAVGSSPSSAAEESVAGEGDQ